MTVATELVRLRAGAPRSTESDELAAEEPLEIRIDGVSVAVVMRTPGEDRELAAGFLLSEGLVANARDIFDITACTSSVAGAMPGNIVDVLLRDPRAFDPAKFTRHVFASSSCGICGKTSIEAIRQQFPAIKSRFQVSPETLLALPARLAGAQKTFQCTGGLHACALFDSPGELLALREDVGRHNALDKLLGWALLESLLPLRKSVLLLSGRVSFEMVQKALAGGIPVVAAISAPSSLAVDFARENGQTLVGFLRGQGMNIYAGETRIR